MRNLILRKRAKFAKFRKNLFSQKFTPLRYSSYWEIPFSLFLRQRTRLTETPTEINQESLYSFKPVVFFQNIGWCTSRRAHIKKKVCLLTLTKIWIKNYIFLFQVEIFSNPFWLRSRNFVFRYNFYSRLPVIRTYSNYRVSKVVHIKTNWIVLYTFSSISLHDRNQKDKYIKVCPICDKEIKSDLVRHLKSKTLPDHNLDDISARNLSYKQRKPYSKKVTESKPKKKNYHVRRICLISGCGREMNNPSEHLSGYHKITDPEQRQSLLAYMRAQGELKVWHDNTVFQKKKNNNVSQFLVFVWCLI